MSSGPRFVPSSPANPMTMVISGREVSVCATDRAFRAPAPDAACAASMSESVTASPTPRSRGT